jgi:uncharacterized FlaG/YvyC family protein
MSKKVIVRNKKFVVRNNKLYATWDETSCENIVTYVDDSTGEVINVKKIPDKHIESPYLFVDQYIGRGIVINNSKKTIIIRNNKDNNPIMGSNIKTIIENKPVTKEKEKLIGDIIIYHSIIKHTNAERRNIIIVGIRYKADVRILEAAKEIPHYQIRLGKLIGYSPRISEKAFEKHTVVKLGYSITHPNDIENFDYDYGVQLAIKRALNGKKRIISTSYSMMGNDRFKKIVQDELDHISKHIENYIKK